MNYKKALICTVLAVLILISLISCNKKDEQVPDGCVEISADGVGYNLYMIDTWLPNEQSGITSAMFNDFDTSNISMMGFDAGGALSAEDYWNRYSNEYTAVLGEISYEENGTDTKFGGTAAKKYIYTAKLGDIDYKFMQIVSYLPNSNLMSTSPEVYVFTYTATADKYDEHIEDVIYMADNVVFE